MTQILILKLKNQVLNITMSMLTVEEDVEKAKVEVVAVLKLLTTMVRVLVKSVLEVIMMLQYVGTGMSLHLTNPKLVATIHTPTQEHLTSILMLDPLLT
jgi:hypothetical protein